MAQRYIKHGNILSQFVGQLVSFPGELHDDIKIAKAFMQMRQEQLNYVSVFDALQALHTNFDGGIIIW